LVSQVTKHKIFTTNCLQEIAEFLPEVAVPAVAKIETRVKVSFKLHGQTGGIDRTSNSLVQNAVLSRRGMKFSGSAY
jgi:hypothetical protein